MKEVLRFSHVSCTDLSEHGLIDLSFSVFENEIVCILGPSDSGKSTLRNLLDGKVLPNGGYVFLGEKPICNFCGSTFRNAGVRYISGNNSLAGSLSVSDNLFLLRRANHFKFFYHSEEAAAESSGILQDFDVHINPDQRVDMLPSFEKYLLCIAKEASFGAVLAVIDISSTQFSYQQIHDLCKRLKLLTGKGISFLIIGDDIRPLRENADRIVLLQEGCNIRTFDKNHYDEEIVQYCLETTRQPQAYAESNKVFDGSQKPVLRIQMNHDDIYCQFPGQILGVFDQTLDASSSFIQYLIKLENMNHIEMIGTTEKIPIQKADQNIVTIPETSADNLIESLSIADNLIIPVHQKVSNKFGVINKDAREFLLNEYCSTCKINSKKERIADLNRIQRKILSIFRFVLIKPKIILLENPGYGLNVTERAQLIIYLEEISKGGIPVLLTSRSFPFLLETCDSVLFADNGVYRRMTI